MARWGLGLLSIAACVPDDITEQPLQGEIDGVEWTFAGGDVNRFLSDDEQAFGVLYGVDDVLCETRMSPDESEVIAFLPLEVGTYPLRLPGRTVTFAFGEGENVIASRGLLRIDSVTEEAITGGLAARAGLRNHVDGEFTVDRCPEVLPFAIDAFIGGTYLLELGEAALSSSGGAFIAFADPADPLEVSLTIDALSFGNLTASVPDLQATFEGTWSEPSFDLRADVIVQEWSEFRTLNLLDARLRGTVTNDASAIVDGSLTFTIDGRELGFELADFCDVLVDGDGGCGPCPGDGVVACANSTVENLVGRAL